MTQVTWQRVQKASSALSTKCVREMEGLPWFGALPPEQRSYVGLVLHAALDAFADWLRDPSRPLAGGPDIFAAAPRELARIVNLKQTVQLIRVAIDVIETNVARLAAPGDEAMLRDAVLRYSREIAFAAADVYAAAAEARGAWDARVEAGVVDALVRGHAGELTLSRAASLGWRRGEWVVALAFRAPDDPADLDLAGLRVSSRHSGLVLLAGEAADALVLVVGGSGPVDRALVQVTAALPPGPVVVGPIIGELGQAATSVQEALSALTALAAWPNAPRPVAASDLLAERAVLGDAAAHRRLLEEVYKPMLAAGGDLIGTAAAYLEGGSSVEGTSRALFLHPNTVRYRLRKLAEILGRDLADPRQALVVRVALVLGRSVSL